MDGGYLPHGTNTLAVGSRIQVTRQQERMLCFTQWVKEANLSIVL